MLLLGQLGPRQEELLPVISVTAAVVDPPVREIGVSSTLANVSGLTVGTEVGTDCLSVIEQCQKETADIYDG